MRVFLVGREASSGGLLQRVVAIHAERAEDAFVLATLNALVTMFEDAAHCATARQCVALRRVAHSAASAARAQRTHARAPPPPVVPLRV
mgnify:CR=1 FL=1|jgi:hypothetical protein